MNQIAWLPLCAGLTGVGLVASFLLLRRRSAAAGLRLAAWSLLPMAAYLTGALNVLWSIGTSVVRFVTNLVFSPTVWAGVALAGLSVVLYLVSGVLRSRALAKAGTAQPRQAAEAAPGRAGLPGSAATTQPLPRPDRQVTKQQAPKQQAPKRQAPAKQAADDDFSDIEDILKRRGIS
jgi:hypothetical protein